MPDGPLTLDGEVPDAATRAAILELAERVSAADGAPALSDQARTLLGSPAVTHLVARGEDAVVGYAQRAAAGLEVVAEAGIGELLDHIARPDDLVWTHGRRSRLIDTFESRGWSRDRELFQLRRPFDAGSAPLPPDPPLADGVSVRAFEPGSDEGAWLAVNAAAFVTHPEQGRWTRSDLDAREHETWFDPAGLLLAERGSQLLGFHWTKVHPDGWGEVYVIAVAPTAQGLGLGKALLVRGLRLLAQRGCPGVLLYVDGDNAGARHLYERAGFGTHDVDVQWRVAAR